MDYEFVIFSDGACSGNPGPGGWASIVMESSSKISELAGREISTTNNRMELQASIEGLRLTPPQSKVLVFTDSTYVIRGITQWVFGWQRNNWKTSQGDSVANQDLWENLSNLCRSRKIKWSYVPGHSGVIGNERVDELAVCASQGQIPKLYSGNLSGYKVNLFPLPTEFDLPKLSSMNKVKAKAYSYLSLVNGQLKKHDSWASCEAQVKGVSGARFKKAMNAEEEAEIISSWGYDPEQFRS